MKKLLTILGAIGLTATAGATVVACGNTDKDKDSAYKTATFSREVAADEISSPWGLVFNSEAMRKEIEKTYNVTAKEIKDDGPAGRYGFYLNEDKTMKIDGKDVKQKKDSRLDLSAGFLTEKAKDWEDFDKNVDKFKEDIFTEKEDSLTIKIYSFGEKDNNKVLDFEQKDTTLGMKFIVSAWEAKSLTDIKLNDFVVGTNKEIIDSIVQEDIAKLTGGRAVKGTDYTISADETLEAGNVITVSTAETSKLIKDNLEVKIAKYDISNVHVPDVLVGTSLDEIKETIQTMFNIVISGTECGVDYTVTDTDMSKKDEVVTVLASDKSKLISGKFEFKVLEGQDIAKLLPKEKLDLGKVDSTEAAVSKAKEVINGISELKDKVQLGDPINGKIKVTPLENENTLTGEAEFKYEINKKDIKDIKITGITVEMSKADIEAKILEAVKVVAEKAEATDYDVKGLNETVKEGDEIVVTAKEESELITGSFSFKVAKDSNPDEIFDISNLEIKDVVVGMTKAQVEAKVLAAIKAEAPKVTEKDYTILGLNKVVVVDEEFTVTANDNSEVIKGEFSFNAVAK